MAKQLTIYVFENRHRVKKIGHTRSHSVVLADTQAEAEGFLEGIGDHHELLYSQSLDGAKSGVVMTTIPR